LVVLFGLASAIAWGAGDFGGGMASRRGPVVGVSLVVQALGGVIAVGLALVAAEPVPDPAALAISVAAGLAVVVGILCLYHGLAVGRMGIVAPVTAVIAATMPVVFGMVRSGLPSAPVLAGIGLALVAVVLVSRVPASGDGRSGIEFGVVGGIGIGLFNILIGDLPDGLVFGPLVVIKASAVIGVAVFAVVSRRAWRLPRAALPIALAAGLFDMAGNILYVLATQAGRLDVAATLSSLYPVTTILLAIGLLGERITRYHAVGIAAALAGIVLISAGGGA
jgi:drug/metabolite transporter (DMT)-like permease